MKNKYKYISGEVVEQPSMEKPVWDKVSDVYDYLDNFSEKYTAYNDHIKTRKRYPVPEQYWHVWKEGQPLEGKDFEFQLWCPTEKGECNGHCSNCSGSGMLYHVAIPIEPKQEPLQPFQYGTQGAHAMHEQSKEPVKSAEEIKLSILIDKGNGYLFTLQERAIIFKAMEAYRNQDDDRLDKVVAFIDNLINNYTAMEHALSESGKSNFELLKKIKQFLQSLTTQNKPVT